MSRLANVAGPEREEDRIAPSSPYQEAWPRVCLGESRPKGWEYIEQCEGAGRWLFDLENEPRVVRANVDKETEEVLVG